MKTVIDSRSDTLSQYVGKLWKQRVFILVLAKRDLKIKYAQTLIGLGWSIVQPLTAVVVFTLFFGVLLDMDAEYPYPLYVLSGVASWNLFNYIFSHGSTSLMNNQNLIRKLSFPKMILPISKVVVGLVEFSIVLALLVPLYIWYRMPLIPNMLLLPVVVGLIVLFSLGISLGLSAATIRNRDLHHIIPFLVNFGIWLTPVFYPVSLIPDRYAEFIYLNPMASLIAIFRWTLFGGELSGFTGFGVVISIIFLMLGVIYFKRVEDHITETV